MVLRRPVTAIEEADEDLVPLTAPARWLPLLITLPSLALEQHGLQRCRCGARARRCLRDQWIAIMASGTTTRQYGTPVATRNYAGFWEMALDQGRSRVYGGIHFTFVAHSESGACAKVADLCLRALHDPARPKESGGAVMKRKRTTLSAVSDAVLPL